MHAGAEWIWIQDGSVRYMNSAIAPFSSPSSVVKKPRFSRIISKRTSAYVSLTVVCVNFANGSQMKRRYGRGEILGERRTTLVQDQAMPSLFYSPSLQNQEYKARYYHNKR
jgi:hypothetical protein